jgi:hypothetical protein
VRGLGRSRKRVLCLKEWYDGTGWGKDRVVIMEEREMEGNEGVTCRANKKEKS